MSHEHQHDHHDHFAIKLGFDIAKIALKAATVCAAFCAIKEIHKVHKAIEAHKK